MAITTTATVHVHLQGPVGTKLQTVVQLLKDVRQLDVSVHGQESQGNLPKDATISGSDNLLQQLRSLAIMLRSSDYPVEAEALLEVYELATTPADFGGLGLAEHVQVISEPDVAEILFLVSAQLEALNSAERAKIPLKPLSSRPAGRRGMTLSEKILAAHDVDRKGEVRPGDIIRVDVDWIMASELSWRVCSSFSVSEPSTI